MESKNTEMNQKPEQKVRVRCLKNFNLAGHPDMHMHGTEIEITAQEVELLHTLGLTSGEFIQVLDPAFKPAPQATQPIQPLTWTQTHGGKADGSGVIAGLTAPAQAASAPAPVETPAEDQTPVETTTVPAPGASGTETPEPAPVKRSLNLKKK